MKKFLWTLLFAALMMPMAAHAQCTDGTPCQFTIYGEDSYGDGWEGDLYIYRNNVAYDTFTVEYDEDSLTYTVCAGDLIRIEWAGADQYYENYFTIISNGVTLVSNAAGITYAPSGTVVQFIACPSCSPVTAPAVTGLTSSSCTLTWTDANNSGATYTIYDLSDTSVVATGITTTSYTINTLTPATAYAFGIVANCSATDESTPVVVSFTSPCEAVALPFAESFATSSTTLTCWGLVASGNVGGSYGAGLVDINGYSAFRFSSYSSASDYNQYLYSPLLDVSSNATGLMVNVRYATYGSNDQLKFGYITATDTVWDPTTYTSSGSSDWQVYSMAIPATAQQLVVHYYGNYSYYAWLDSVNVAEITTSFCYAVTGLTASDITSTSVTLTWSDANNSGATYSIYNMADSSVVASSVNDTTYTITNLDANTNYTFGVAANCSSTSESDFVTVSIRTNCAPEALPFFEDFSSSLSTNPCWRGASNATAAQVFAGTALTLGNPSSWTHASSTRDGFAAGHYYKNVYGSSVKSWMITPAIDLSTVSSAQLSFDVALTDYYNAALPDVDGDTNTSQAFMVIISTDGGNTWDSTNATIWQNVGGDYTYASLASLTYQNKVIDLTPYAGDTIKIAFYCQSLWSGGDNDLHLDNIAVTEIGGGDTTVVADSCTLIISVNDPTMGTTTPAPGIYMHATTDSAVTITALPYTGHTFTGWHISILADSSMFDTTFYVADPALNYMMVDFSTTTPAGAICSVTALFNNGSVVDSGYYLTVNYDSTMGDVYYFDGPYQAGDSAFVWAMANPGYRFVSFTEGTTVVSTDAIYEFVMTANRTLTANFEVDTNASADSLTIILAVNDATMGTTTPAPGTYRYGEGDVFTVTATPNNGYFFAGWVLSMDLGGFIYNDTMSVYDGVPATLSDTVTYDHLGMVMGLTALFTADSMPVINTDSVTITLAVNDATMGTISPAPGTYTYAETDSIHIVATPNNGYYFIGWRFQTSIYGMDIDTIILTSENYFHETLEDMGGMSLTLTAMFSADTNVTLYTVNVAVNDATMGSVSGAGQYVAGTTATLTATPREGYTFVGWVIGNDTLTANPYTFTVTADVNVLAIFTAGSTGIEDADMTNVNVYSAESRIIVRGAEGKDVYVYDLNGRMVSSQLNAADAVEFRMANTGVYLVKVGTASAKRVLVVR